MKKNIKEENIENVRKNVSRSTSNRMKNIFKLFVFASFIFLLSSTQVFAIEKVATTNSESSNVVFIATTSIREAKIISQDENIINLSFNIENSKGVQSEIKYSVKLIKETDKGQFIADEYVYPELLNLSENSLIKKEVIYTAPSNINGKYTVLITLNNESGLTLGLGVAGEINLISKANIVEILPETCSVSVVGEKNNKTYTLSQGVDIKSAENLSLTCGVINSSPESIIVTPFYETHYRNIYGEIVSTKGGDFDKISFKGTEKKSISLLLPKTTIPQAYDIKVSLGSGNNKSNFIIVHYVLRGASATIQNLSLDKDFYSKNENIKLSLFWSPSADNFPGSRMKKKEGTDLSEITLFTTIVNNINQKCITPMNQIITESPVELSISVIKNCKDPKVSVTLKDSSNNILAEKTLSFKTSKEIPNRLNINVFVILGVIIIFGFIVYFINLRKKENEKNN